MLGNFRSKLNDMTNKSREGMIGLKGRYRNGQNEWMNGLALDMQFQLLPSTRTTLLINWRPKFSQDCSILSGSLALEALLIGVHSKKRYINV